jgi:hypothetical protein
MKWFVYLICTLFISSCAAQQTKEEDATAGAQVGIVNHTDNFIYSASVDGVGGRNDVEVGGWHCEYLLHRHPQSLAPRYESAGAVEYARGAHRRHQRKNRQCRKVWQAR